MAGPALAPLATRGFRGQYYRRGTRKELKFVDTGALNTAITATWQVVHLNGVAQGSDYNQRIGRHMYTKSILANILCYNGNLVVNSQPQGIGIRVLLIWDYQPNSAGAVPTGLEIFSSNTCLSAMNLNNRDRFKVIKDWKTQIGAFTIGAGPPTVLTAGAPQNRYLTTYKKCNLETIFSGTTAALSSQSTGALYLCWIADVLGAGIDYMVRSRFED